MTPRRAPHQARVLVDALVAQPPGGRRISLFQHFFKTLISDPNLRSDKNTGSVLYVETLIVTENKKIRDLKLINKYKGYE